MRIVSDEARIRYNENRNRKRAENRKIKSVCDECGNAIEEPKLHRSYCFTCSAKREGESKRRWVERNPVKVRKIKDESNRKKRDRASLNAKTFTCRVCGHTSRQMGNKTQCQGECRRITRAKREMLRHIPKTQRNGTVMSCLLCGGATIRSAHNKKYCPDCEKRIASHRERRRSLQKRQVGGSHTKIEFSRSLRCLFMELCILRNVTDNKDGDGGSCHSSVLRRDRRYIKHCACLSLL